MDIDTIDASYILANEPSTVSLFVYVPWTSMNLAWNDYKFVFLNSFLEKSGRILTTIVISENVLFLYPRGPQTTCIARGRSRSGGAGTDPIGEKKWRPAWQRSHKMWRPPVATSRRCCIIWKISPPPSLDLSKTSASIYLKFSPIMLNVMRLAFLQISR